MILLTPFFGHDLQKIECLYKTGTTTDLAFMVLSPATTKPLLNCGRQESQLNSLSHLQGAK